MYVTLKRNRIYISGLVTPYIYDLQKTFLIYANFIEGKSFEKFITVGRSMG